MRGRTTLKKNLTDLFDLTKLFLLVKLFEGRRSFIEGALESRYIISLSRRLLAKRFSGFFGALKKNNGIKPTSF